jgi:2-dehydro-3-deoxygluconokinase
MSLQLRPAADCQFDAVALGEVMLRLDPGEGRIRTARQFHVWGVETIQRLIVRANGSRVTQCV